MNGLTVLVTLLGTVLVFFTLRDIFHEIVHPSGAGGLSGVLIRFVWRSLRRLVGRRPGALSLAGPLSLFVVIASWAALLAVGWALVYWPYMPDNFLYQTGLNPSAQDGFVDVLYYSLVTLATLGYGDIVPTAGPLRILAPVEAMVGFVLLTAWITWVLSIYPALTRRRLLAQQATVLRDAQSESGIDVVEAHPETAEQVFRDLASQVLAVRSDLQQFHITYFFHSTDEKSTLSAALPYLARLAQRGREEGRPPEVRLSATMLRRSLDDLAATVASSFLGLSPDTATEKVLEAYARDHLRKPLDDDEA